MYYHNNPNVVETDDILGIKEWDFQPAQEGTYPLLTMTVVLDPHKRYDPQQFHVTNGVEPRLLAPGYVLPEDQAGQEAETTAKLKATKAKSTDKTSDTTSSGGTV